VTRAKPTAAADLPVERVPLSRLKPDPKNARMHGPPNLAAIEASLAKFGQRKPIVVSRNMTVVAGNGTLEAATNLGWNDLWVTIFPGTAAEARAFAIADNRTAELATWDEQQLVTLLESLDQPLLSATGFDPTDIDHLLNSIRRSELGQPGTNDVPAIPKRAISKTGDIWLLGDSRLLVGDATDGAAVALMLDGDRCDCMWTDPPYGVDYNDFVDADAARAARRRTDGLRVQNDGASYEATVRAAFAVADAVLWAGAPFYVAHPSGPQCAVFQQIIIDAGWDWRQSLMWMKDRFVLGRSDYHYQHEPILYGFTGNAAKGTGRRGRGGRRWFGDNAQTSVFEVARPARSEEHPTMKPVELVAPMIGNSVRPGGLVYDPFAGSGSTLIAAHTIGRATRLVEIDPLYADVICRRFEQFTGITPVHADTDEKVSFTTR
jgi:DNA modification methylase